jgi:hypothetical protein
METIVEASKQFRDGTSDYKRTYEVQMTLMGITVAHELCHLFVAFLAGFNRSHTPPLVAYLERDVEVKGGKLGGESGRYWEAEVFGGEIRHFAEPLPDPKHPGKHPLGYRQAGDLWVLNKETTRMTLVGRDSITGILAFGM